MPYCSRLLSLPHPVLAKWSYYTHLASMPHFKNCGYQKGGFFVANEALSFFAIFQWATDTCFFLGGHEEAISQP